MGGINILARLIKVKFNPVTYWPDTLVTIYKLFYFLTDVSSLAGKSRKGQILIRFCSL